MSTRRFAQLVTEVPGPRSRELTALESAYLAPGIQQISTLSGLAMERGEGAVLIDVDGNRYLDFVAGIGVASIGHGHPALTEALAQQAARLSCGSFTSAARASLLRRIVENSPDPRLCRVQLYSGGAEAVESALRLARAYTKRHEVLAFWGGFHGKTGGVIGLMGSAFKQGLGPVTPGQHLAPYADCSRCLFLLKPDSCGLYCVEFLRSFISHNTSGSLAAILVEPIQGTAGNIIPPPGWLTAVQKVAKELGALLIVDEMITGWGRTGQLWASAGAGLAPDIVTFGKGVAAGFPVSGLLATQQLMQAEPWCLPSFSSSSFGGNPLAAAAADAVTRTIVAEQLPENAKRVGAQLLQGLQQLQQRHEVLGEVRGRGLLLGVDLVADRKTLAPLDRASCEQLFFACLRRGLLTMSYAPRLRINPPLVLTSEQAAEGLEILDEALTELARNRSGRAVTAS